MKILIQLFTTIFWLNLLLYCMVNHYELFFIILVVIVIIVLHIAQDVSGEHNQNKYLSRYKKHFYKNKTS
jgi:hypothetical protein